MGSNEGEGVKDETYNLKVEWQANFSEIHFSFKEEASEIS